YVGYTWTWLHYWKTLVFPLTMATGQTWGSSLIVRNPKGAFKQVCSKNAFLCVFRQYMVVCPAVLQAGVETKLCASLLQPNESLVMTVTLMSEDSQTVLLETTTDEDFHTCIQFQAPSVKNKEVQSLAVAVKGDTFYSTADRRVLFQPYVPMTFVQTDKPIYLPGQTATIFSYLISCIMVSVTPSPSSDYTLTPLSDDQYTSCLCGSERKTLSWTMTPSALGEDGSIIIRSRMEQYHNAEVWLLSHFFSLYKGDVLTEETELQLPWNLIEGSARASVSVLGDILGRALENLDQLLKMPFGCGEQNMVLLAPNIYILLYLENTKQLTPAIRSKATNFMISGYQRQLNYKLSNGAYSTFGSNPGITWLTAFVLRCFVRAQSFIYIDPKNIEEAKTWLMSKQQPNGCFEMSGKLFHNLMKGGVSDEVTLSAYITAAFLEMKTSADVSKYCSSPLDLSNTYTTALMAYVFTLAGDTETRNHLLQHLDSVAVREGNSLHWSQKAAETSASLSVEISSYVLLAKLSSSPTDEDAAHASEISRWLIGQQNSYGGFTSTQDTVVALQALALYATVVYSLEGSSTVTVQAPSGALLFEVNPDNKLLYQERALQDVTGNFSLEAKGSACAAVQVSERLMASAALSHFLFCYTNFLHDATNMVILDIKALSGFVPDTQSLRHHWTVDRVDQKDDHILVYLRELKKDMAVSHTLELIQEVPVKNLKPAVVKIYDYYQPSKKKLIIFFLII
uniref:Alpha-macroglobulin receptor-binding domain-containing protein n=1 Tax=Salarias fasciatus TaxID=181472 RepID=A0A672JGD3_SALFA